MKYKCSCCEYYTLKIMPNDTYEVCPVCFWTENSFQFKNPDSEKGENGISLNTARENFKKFGASQEKFMQYSREPVFQEKIGLEEYGERYK